MLDIEETGSGARNDRPGLQRLMDAAGRSKLDMVIVWKLDRFGRSALDVLANIRDLDAAGVRFIAMTVVARGRGALGCTVWAARRAAA